MENQGFGGNGYHHSFSRIEIYLLTNFEPKRTRSTFILVICSIFRLRIFRILNKNRVYSRYRPKVALPKCSLHQKPVRMQNIKSNGWNYGGLVIKMGYRLVKKSIWDFRQENIC